jgi:phosphoribosylglycinamide formyltransferase 1
MVKLGVLVSGSGSNLQAILDAIAGGQLDAEVAVVVSNRADALALDRARRAGVAAEVILHGGFPSREAFDEALVRALSLHGVEWVVLAGFMRLVTPVLLGAFPRRVLNIHPALLPSFPGTHAQAQALAYGVRVTGVSVHIVDVGTDTGPIVAQTPVSVEPDDTLESLTARIHAAEHTLLVSVLQAVSEGRVEVTVGESGARDRVSVRRR